MSYESAPATKLLATHCIFCNRPLLDAASVEAGIGPVCREKVGYNDPVSDSDRKQANKLVHTIATNRQSPEVNRWITEIAMLGLERLSIRLKEALADIRIEQKEDKLWIKAPYLEAALGDWRRIPGRLFDRGSKRNVVPSDQRVEVYRLLSRHYKGSTGLGPKGLFVI